MMLLKLAFRNLKGAGIRSWLNAAVISLALVATIWNQSLLVGWDEQSSRATVDISVGGGQYWQADYDPYDALTIEASHAPVPEKLQSLVAAGRAVPILVASGTIYPKGRMRTVLLKGIDPGQSVLTIPSGFLKSGGDEIPALIGARMAKSSGLAAGDIVTVRWREAGGSFNALDVRIVQIMNTMVQTVDSGQLWIPLDRLQSMMNLKGEATLVVLGKDVPAPGEIDGWSFQSRDSLLQDIRDIIKTKSIGRVVMFVVLLLLGMLAIFDTQVLSIFRRKKEMGTLMALGFTRGKVILLFTLEGALHGILAVFLAILYGVPLLYLQAVKGYAMPPGSESFGFAIGEKIFPVYSVGLIAGVTVLVLVVTTFVSYLPTRRISKLKPTDALRGGTA
jgi:putative ABC transport system permease protein